MEATLKLYAALMSAQQNVRTLGKDARNQGGGNYRYLSAEKTIHLCKAALLSQGLMIVPGPTEMTMIGETLCLRRDYTLIHAESGEMMAVTSPPWPVTRVMGTKGIVRDLDKGVAVASTSALKYLYRDLLQVPRVDGNDDMDDEVWSSVRGESRTNRDPDPAPARDSVRSEIPKARDNYDPYHPDTHAPEQQGSRSGKPAHHKSYTDSERKHFCAELGRLGYRYDDVALYIETQQKQAGKPVQRPSSWTVATRRRFIEKLEGDPVYRDGLNNWIAQVESAATPF